MLFTKYNSIENACSRSAMTWIAMIANQVEWVAQEKIHGANFSVWHNGVETRFAKRIDFIEDVEPIFLDCGSRAILKNKNEKFAERKPDTEIPKITIENVSDEARAALEWMLSGLTEARFDSAVSNIGPVSIRDMGPVLKALNQVVIAEFIAENAEVWDGVPKLEKLVTKTFNKAAAAFTRERLMFL